MADQIEEVREALRPRYEIEREIGRGATAVVYSAQDRQLGRPVAIKVLLPRLAVTIGAERFLREVRIESRLQHPHILALHDHGHVGQFLYYVMPFLEGESLRERLLRDGPLALDETLRLAAEIADGLDYAHGQDVVHRDIKPGNILLSSGHAVIADFGLAHALSDVEPEKLTTSGLTVGTPMYMSPEQAGGNRVDRRSDIYALGCVVFEMLSGEPPFMGRTAQAVIARQITERPPSVSVVRPDLPPHVNDAVHRALAKTPADRFDTAGAFAAALNAERAVVPSPLPRWKRAAAAAVSLAAAVALWIGLRPDPPHYDANKIVVFPLQTLGAVGGALDGIDVALMIGIALEQTEPLKWIDGWHRLDESQRRDVTLLTADAAGAIARDRGARYYLDGTVRRAEEQLSVTLRLHDAVGDSLVRRESATATMPDRTASDLGLDALVGLLPTVIDPERPVDLSAIANRSPAAVAVWLQGEREYRLSRFESALEFYRRAVDTDSTLAFAALKGAQAASWAPDRGQEAEVLAAVALTNARTLPTRHRAFARGLWHYVRGAADSAVARLRDALAIQPEWAEATTALGEVYHHLLPTDVVVDSTALAMFRNALIDDPHFTPPLVHLAEAALRRGEAVAADTLIRLIADRGADVDIVDRLTLMVRCVRDSPRTIDWDTRATTNPELVMEAAKVFAGTAAQPACAEAGFRAMRQQPPFFWGSTLGLQNLLIAQGRENEAVAILDSAVAAGDLTVLAAYLLGAISGAGGDAVDAKAQWVVDLVRDRTNNNYDVISNPQTLYLLGVWQSLNGGTAELERLRDALQRHAVQPRAQLFADALSARLIAANGDLANAIVALRRIAAPVNRRTVAWEIGDVVPAERLLLAELLAEQERWEEAERAAAVLDHPAPIAFVPFLPSSLALRVRIAERMGNPMRAIEYRERLSALGRRLPESARTTLRRYGG